MKEVLITNDAVVFGLLMIVLAAVLKTSTSKSPFWKGIYSIVPALLLCYFIPAMLNTWGVIDGEKSKLYFMASRYLLPSSLILLTLGTDFKAILKLGPNALIMFLTGTVGIVLGGPIALLIMSSMLPDLVGTTPDQLWRGMTTIAGSWIGGGANQAAMKEVFGVDDITFSKMVTVDVLIANVWMAFLLIGAGKTKIINQWLGADDSSIEEVKERMEGYQASISRTPSMSDLMMVLAIGLGGTGLAHLVADTIVPFLLSHYPSLEDHSLTGNFFWVVVVATLVGLGLSFTQYRKMEGLGASKIGSVFIYILVATIGMQMDVLAIIEAPGLFLLGIVWMLVHIALLLAVGRLIHAPFFFIAVGSQANVGGAASAPIVAAAFHPALAPVGVLLAVLGYSLGTFAAILCGYLMQIAMIQ